MSGTSTGNTGFFLIVTIGIAAMLTISPLCAERAQASQNKSVATMLLGKPLDTVHRHFDGVRNRPSPQADLAKTFDERDYYRKGAAAAMGGDDEASLFIDMRHNIDQITETWHGSAGVQFFW